uniref:Uncharacterized protein n=1 Tax=Vitis vinifera TaxID=29760 RepID=A5AGS6_VITVI|nr:hypothetical protein VITISV_011850 [Vitis vinifera]
MYIASFPVTFEEHLGNEPNIRFFGKVGDDSHAQLHRTRDLGRDHLAMVVVEASNDGWSRGTGESVEFTWESANRRLFRILAVVATLMGHGNGVFGAIVGGEAQSSDREVVVRKWWKTVLSDNSRSIIPHHAYHRR